MLWETQNCVATGGATAFNCNCAKHRTVCQWWSNGFQVHLFCEAQKSVVTGGAKACKYTCAKSRIALSLVEQRLSITLAVRNTELRCHWSCNDFQLHLLCETQNCVVTVGGTAFNYTWCAKLRNGLWLLEGRHSITLGVRSTELGCYCWRNGIQLQLLCETQICVFTGILTAFNYTCWAKHIIALPLLLQRISITLLLRNTELRCHWCCNGFKLHLLCETQNCFVTRGATAFNYTCAKHRVV